MTDEEILEEVYNQLCTPLNKLPTEYRAWVWKVKLIRKFIEDERQKRDDPNFTPTNGLRNEIRIQTKGKIE